MPGLVGGAGEGDVEADLDDFVVGAQHRFADGDEPGMGGDVDEAAHPLRVDLDVEALRTARQRSSGDRPRLFEKRLDVLAHLVGPFRAEGALQRDDAVAVEPAHDAGDFVLLLPSVRHLTAPGAILASPARFASAVRRVSRTARRCTERAR